MTTAAAAAPASARRLLIGVAALGLTLLSVLLYVDSNGVALLPAAILAAAVAGGEAIRVDLSYRRGGIAVFTLGHASLAAGLLVLPGGTVVLAATTAIAIWQLAERIPRLKLTFNVLQYLAGTAAAALVVEFISPRPGPLDGRTLAAAAAALSLCCAVNTVAVSGMISAFGGRSWAATMRQMAQSTMLLAGGSVAVGLLAVLLATDHLWALPTLIVPLGLLHAASRREVQAQTDGERAVAYVDVEQRLAEATDPEHVHARLVEGVRSMLGCSAAVWANNEWATPVPSGSTPCTVNPHVSMPISATGPALGPNIQGPCVAVGIGNGVLIVWSGELPLREAAHEWLERLGSSGRVHGARSAADAALRRERATLRAIVHGTADGIFVMDPHGGVVLCNPAMAELAQVDDTAVAGARAEDVFGEGPWSEEGVRDVIRPDDRVWRIAVSAVRDRAHGDLRVAVVHDVSAERRVARMKDDMLSIVSHELRTPLTPIKGSAQLLRRRWDRMNAGQREDMLRTIEQRADHLTRLVEDLLLVGQMSTATDTPHRLQPIKVDMVELLRETTLQLDAGHPMHTVLLTAPDELTLHTDPLRVRQIIDNLVNNACKFSPSDSIIQVSLIPDAEWAIVRVTDQGRGIPPEDVDRVFERFERVEDPLHMTTSGAGLGLYIVRSLTERLGGDVAMASVLGTGTTVTVRLPLNPAVTAPEERISAVA
ncbi:MAG: PAS domain-containing protein [Nitriliruptorales bacterium]|nr:PAS domain-containing protein [Nitriliruptorales bacterium]